MHRYLHYVTPSPHHDVLLNAEKTIQCETINSDLFVKVSHPWTVKGEMERRERMCAVKFFDCA